MATQVKTIKKLIEVALPLDDINVAAAREKSIRHGHPSTMHLWWARRPLAAARAVIFAQMVNDPGGNRGYGPGKSKVQVQLERERLFDIIRKLVLWENTSNQPVLDEASAEIWKSWREICELNRNHPRAQEIFNPELLPGFHDPFSGGGAIPLEAQRLGLQSNASDLNPVAVLINKAMIEIPPRFVGCHPVGPIPEAERQGKLDQDWSGASGLAEDVRRYGAWIRDEAIKKIGFLFPQVNLPEEYGNRKATVIAWIWARTVKSPNPAFSHVEVPLASTFVLSKRAGSESYIHPVIEGDAYRFEIRNGKPPEGAMRGTTAGKRSAFLCLMSGVPIDYNYIRAEGKAGRMGQKLMAVVVEGDRTRIYLPPTEEMETLALSAKPGWRPESPLPDNTRDFKTPNYGLMTFGSLFTDRQLVALTTLSDLVVEARSRIVADFKNSVRAGKSIDSKRLVDGGVGAESYADALSVYLAFAVDRVVDRHSNIATWDSSPSKLQLRNTFARQAIPMTWDFGEGNPFCTSSGTWSPSVEWVAKAIESLPCKGMGTASQEDAARQDISTDKLISTDPPYYDNIGYADLSDFFYVWLRRILRDVYPSLFSTMAVPKAEELVATPYRHGNKEKAESFFLTGMTEAMHRLAEQAHPAFPTTIYYAFKQSDTTDVGTGNTGWETFLQAVIRAGFAINGTWPMRTEMANRMIGSGANALASSIVLVCRKRDLEAPSISRREFLRELKDELVEAVQEMIGGTEGISPVAPVDLAQAVIGPGMAVFSKYSAVLEADGSQMSVHTALTLINRMLTEGGDDFESDTQFCLAWFDQYGWSEGPFGEANTLAQAKATSVDGAKDAGVVESGGGKVRLLKPNEYPSDWSPETDNRTPIWEALHQLIRSHRSGGDVSAGSLLARMHERSEPIRLLAYRLYTLCERKGWAEDARAYNELVTAWPHIESASHEAGHVGSQAMLDI